MNVAKIQKLYFDFYEWGKKKLIAKGVKNFVKNNLFAPNALTKEERKQAEAFWAPYVKLDPVFHSFYKEKTGVFYPEHLPTDIYINCIDEYFNDRSASHVMDNKCLYPRLFPKIPQVISVASRLGGYWYNENLSMISTVELRELLNQQEAVFVKKATRSFGGKGVLHIDASDGELYSKVMSGTEKWAEDIVIQKPLKQHESLSAVNESSVNTIRITSLLTEKGVKIYSAILRMGVAGAKVDNASSGGITCGITEEGRLKKYAYRPSGERFEKHPTSGLVFADYVIPHFEKAKDLVRQAHPMVPHFRLVSWDVAIDKNGNAVMIEANLAKGELDFHQLNNGPLFGEDTKKILDEVFGKTK